MKSQKKQAGRQTKSFAIERIIDEKKVGKKSMFLVKWINSEEEDTWEPAESLQNYKELLQEFEQLQSEKKQLQIVDEAVSTNKKLRKLIGSQRSLKQNLIYQGPSINKPRSQSKRNKPVQSKRTSSAKHSLKPEIEPKRSTSNQREVNQEHPQTRSQTKVAQSPSRSEVLEGRKSNRYQKKSQAQKGANRRKSVQSKKSSKKSHVDEGDYEKGDTAYQIVEAREIIRDNNESIKQLLVINIKYCIIQKVQWNPRKDEMIPKQSWALYEEVKENDGVKLIEFLERFQQSQILFKQQFEK